MLLYISNNDDPMKLIKELTEQITKLYHAQNELVVILKRCKASVGEALHIQSAQGNHNLRLTQPFNLWSKGCIAPSQDPNPDCLPFYQQMESYKS